MADRKRVLGYATAGRAAGTDGPNLGLAIAYIIFGIGALICAVVVCRMGLHFWQLHQARSVIRACLAYSAPAGEVVYDEDPDRAARLAADAGRYTLAHGKPTASRPAFRTVPEVLRRVGLAADGPVVFAGAMSTPSGQRRFVAVSLILYAPPTERVRGTGDHRELYFMITSWNPDSEYTVRRASEGDFAGTGSASLILEFAGAQHFQLTAGQPDAVVPSHFTIPYDLDGRAGLIDGYLTEDGDVALQPREGEREPYSRRWHFPPR